MAKLFVRILFTLLFALNCGLSFAEESAAPAPQEPMQALQSMDETPQTVSYQGAFIKMMLTLVALIVLIVLSVWMLRKLGEGRIRQANLGRTIKVLEKRALSAKSILYLIEVQGKKVVIAESQLEVKPITTVEDLPTETN